MRSETSAIARREDQRLRQAHQRCWDEEDKTLIENANERQRSRQHEHAQADRRQIAPAIAQAAAEGLAQHMRRFVQAEVQTDPMPR